MVCPRLVNNEMNGNLRLLDDASIALLRKIADAPHFLNIGVKAINFRAENHKNRGLIDELLRRRFIVERNEKYFLGLISLPEISGYSSQITNLLSWCEDLFRFLRQAYLDSPGEAVRMGKLEVDLSRTSQQIVACISFITESSILAGYASDLYSSDAYVKPSERILDYESFAQIIDELRGWATNSSNVQSAAVPLGTPKMFFGFGAGIEFSHLLHSQIVEHALPKYQDGHYRNAVLDSVIAVFDLIRNRTGLSEDGDELIGKAFSLSKPYLILSEIDSDSGKNNQKGFIQIFKGIYQGVRNPSAHSLSSDLTNIEAAQYLVFASLLARRVEEAKLVKTDDY